MIARSERSDVVGGVFEGGWSGLRLSSGRSLELDAVCVVHDAVEHLSVVRAAITESETPRLGRESHALKGACLTIGASRMADLSKQLESLGVANSMVGAASVLAQLEQEFDRVKNEIEQERLIL